MFRVPHAIAAISVALIAYGFVACAHADSSSCSSTITRASLARCAVEASPVVNVISLDREVAAARLRAASPWLPSNPTLALSLASRRGDADTSATNWYASLSQEIELGGQRAARKESAEAQVEASAQRLVSTRRAVAVAAWKAYFDVLAARDEVVLARRMEALSTSIADATQAFADRGAIAGLDADLADVASSRARQARISAEGRVAASRAVLASLLGVAAEALVVEGELDPIRDVEAKARRSGDAQRPELKALEWEARSFEAKSRMYERQRIPSLTLSGFVQNDGFNERVLGVGLSFPVPLPFPVGRTYAGEISESRASARAVRAEVAMVQSVLRRETLVALAELDARVGERDSITPDKYSRAETTLTTLSNEVKAGKISARDAFVAQQTLMDVLQGRVRTRHAACLASVELARAAGLALEDGEP